MFRNFSAKQVRNIISSRSFNGFARKAAGAAVLGSALFSLSLHSEAKCAADEPSKMYYRMLGNTGLQVSVLSYGFWATFGAKSDLSSQAGIDMAKDCLRVARDAGINLFDNAEAYGNPNGEAERIMGAAIKQLQAEDPVLWRRSDMVITTKVVGLCRPPYSAIYVYMYAIDILGSRWS